MVNRGKTRQVGRPAEPGGCRATRGSRAEILAGEGKGKMGRKLVQRRAFAFFHFSLKTNYQKNDVSTLYPTP